MKIRFETLNAVAFEDYGSVIPTGTPLDHLMDAEIFQSCQNQMRPVSSVPLARPRLRIIQSDPWQAPFELPRLYKNKSERVIFAPVSSSQYLLCVARNRKGKPYQPRAFLMAAGLTVNIKARTWYGRLLPLHKQASHAVVDSNNTDRLLEHFSFQKPVLVSGFSANPS